jgi:Sulfotransferase domain
MRSFGARNDTMVVDEPLHAHYLHVTGLEHPGRAATLARQSTDWRRVVRQLTEGDLPGGKSVQFQKHRATHLLDGLHGPWLERLTHAFLIREPGGQLAALFERFPEVRLADTGLPQQWNLFESLLQRLGESPPVIDAAELASDPSGQLSVLCERLGLDFQTAMLSWPAGPRDSDGPWGPSRYQPTYALTGFTPLPPSPRELPPHQAALLEECRLLYQRLYAHRLRG